MKFELQLVSEETPGDGWRQLYRRFWPAYRDWYYGDGSGERPPRVVAEQRLRQHMPELMPVYRRLLALAGGDADVARFLTLYRPAPYLSGCSQAVWTREEPVLVRNYDYSPRLWEAVLMRSTWNARRVLAMSDCLWGALDGVNDAGLAVSLAFGGRRVVGDGFGSPLILRYILESCESTGEARRVLERVPTHMAYNITVLDSTGDHLTAFLAPDREPRIDTTPLATNHQGDEGWKTYVEATGSVERESFLAGRLEDPQETLETFVERFQEAPLRRAEYERAMGTLYTAVYRPRSGTVQLIWPRLTVQRGLDDFETGRIDVNLADVTLAESLAGPAVTSPD